MDQVQRRSMKMIRRLEQLSYKKAERLGIVQPGEQKTQVRLYCSLSIRDLVKKMERDF